MYKAFSLILLLVLLYVLSIDGKTDHASFNPIYSQTMRHGAKLSEVGRESANSHYHPLLISENGVNNVEIHHIDNQDKKAKEQEYLKNSLYHTG